MKLIIVSAVVCCFSLPGRGSYVSYGGGKSGSREDLSLVDGVRRRFGLLRGGGINHGGGFRIAGNNVRGNQGHLGRILGTNFVLNRGSGRGQTRFVLNRGAGLTGGSGSVRTILGGNRFGVRQGGGLGRGGSGGRIIGNLGSRVNLVGGALSGGTLSSNLIGRLRAASFRSEERKSSRRGQGRRVVFRLLDSSEFGDYSFESSDEDDDDQNFLFGNRFINDDDDDSSLESFEDDGGSGFGREFSRLLVGGGIGGRGRGIGFGNVNNEERLIGVGGLRNRGSSIRGSYRGRNSIQCGPGELVNAIGICQRAVVSRSLWYFDSPELPKVVTLPPKIPPPKIDYKYVFLRAPKQPEPLDPIVVPPPQKKTVLYVLSKNDILEQKVIETPAVPDEKPEVFYLTYLDEENPRLVGKLSLEDVISSLPSLSGEDSDEGRYYRSRSTSRNHRASDEDDGNRGGGDDDGSDDDNGGHRGDNGRTDSNENNDHDEDDGGRGDDDDDHENDQENDD